MGFKVSCLLTPGESRESLETRGLQSPQSVIHPRLDLLSFGISGLGQALGELQGGGVGTLMATKDSPGYRGYKALNPNTTHSGID